MRSDALLNSLGVRLRKDYPEAAAILVHGSYARGEEEAHSDIDLHLLYMATVNRHYQSVLFCDGDGRLQHATIEHISLDDWSCELRAESELWAFYLPVRMEARIL